MPTQTFNCNQIEEIINFSLDSSKGAYKLPLALWGLAGVGKTEFVTQIAQKRGYNLVVLHLATQGDICDLIGMPKSTELKDESGRVIGTSTTWSCPEWLFKALENTKATGKPNLFFLDEFNRGNRFVLSAMLPFLIEGKLHTHRVNQEDAIICAMNPSTDAYEVNAISDEALINRVGHCIFKPTVYEYLEYLKRTGIDQTTLNVLKKNPEFTSIKDFKLDFEITPSRRSIDHVMKVVGKKPHDWIIKNGAFVIEAYLGEKFKEEWISEYNKKDFSITLEMLLDYDNNERYITEALTTRIEGVKTERIDVVSKLLELIKLWLDENRDSLTIENISWMFKFFDNPMIPQDACASIMKTHKFFIEKIHTDKHFNKAICNYLLKKGIINEPNLLKEWSKK
jgi:hypothetical protein